MIVARLILLAFGLYAAWGAVCCGVLAVQAYVVRRRAREIRERRVA